MTYRSGWVAKALKVYLALPDWLQERIARAETVLLASPDPSRAPGVKALRRSRRGQFRLRIGDWRMIFEIDRPTESITVVRLGHRRDVYE